MNTNIKKLIRKNLINFTPYQSARHIGGNGKVFLNANEYPISTKISYDVNLNRYPEPQPKSIINLYASYASVKKDNVIVTRGSDESIEIIIKAFCNPEKDYILYFPPTYDMYKISAEIMGIKYISVPKLSNWQLNIDDIKKINKNVKLIYICSPNNPTGNIINVKDIIKLVEIFSKKSLIIIDEAYIDFCLESSVLSLINKYKNLIILRTLSKAFALAGLRCGFAISNIEIISILKKIIAPYPIPTPVIKIAEKSLNSENILLLKKRVKKIKKNRKFLIQNLKKMSYVKKIFDSSTNYILVKFYYSKKIFEYLCSQGIILRDQSDKLNLKNCIRITIGTYKECCILIKKLNLFIKKNIFRD
ncbi:histidinol-phosphate transaminase [Buchnera aphidicola (Taiwanaphis decaspermi)]|uniref:histidinol-phosphate transaminase n=1 Tax=Buchnera aphidicola TaxID=9 RepID=UPI0031B89439